MQNVCGLLALWDAAFATTAGELEQQPQQISGTAGEQGVGLTGSIRFVVPLPHKRERLVLAAYGELIQKQQVLSGTADVVDVELLMLMVGELTAA